MDLGNGLGHLTYSTLVHQTDNWDQLWKSVNTYLPAVKARVAPHQKFGVCLRTSRAVGRAAVAGSGEARRRSSSSSPTTTSTSTRRTRSSTASSRSR